MCYETTYFHKIEFYQKKNDFFFEVKNKKNNH